MAKAALLDTKTQTFLELIGNGKRYVVPPYQRDYSWTREQWEDLWSDILDLSDKPEEKHYMGALVVEGVDDREFKVIDGQQRLTTLTILSLAIIDRLHKLVADSIDSDANGQRADGLRARFVGDKDPASLVEISKLRLNETDDDFFQEYLVQLKAPINPRALAQSNKLLWECFQWFQSRVGHLPIAQDGERLARLLNDTVARQLLFIQIAVDDELNAYTVFETLNARGLELTVTDLLKNFLFSRVRVAADLQSVQRRWKSLLATVRQERFADFLRYHYSIEQPKVRSARLFKIVRDQVKSAQDVFKLLDVLRERSEIFAAINDSNHEFWIERPGCRRPVRELNLFRAKQMTPLVMVAWHKFSPQEFEKLLRLLVVVTFRYSVVSGLNTNELEPIYHQAARKVLDGEVVSASQVFATLRDIYVEDAAFQENFARLDIDTGGQRKQLVKYILCELESDASSVPRAFETDPATIEHVLPENPSADWEERFPADVWAKNVYRLGNLTLLEGTLNRDIGNSPYAIKTARYPESGYQLTRNVAIRYPEEWSPDAVNERQAALARRAVHAWRSAFA